MNKMNKKGFTIVELVIVIAVIAILAGVLIPTFGGIIDRANESKALQQATAAYKEAYAEVMADGKIENGDSTGESVEKAGYTFTFTGTLSDLTCAVVDEVDDDVNISWSNGVIVVAEDANA